MKATPRAERLIGCLVALSIMAAPGLANMLGTAITGVNDTTLEPGTSSTVPTVTAGTVPPVRSLPSPRASRTRALSLRKGKLQRQGTPLDWHALAACESSNNPRAISRTGKYRGAFQMDADFWRTYGGHRYAPRPDLATLAEQTTVALAGYTARGRAPWPYCGRFL